MSSMCIFRVAKIKGFGQLAAVAGHNLRTRSTPNANPNIQNIVVKGGQNFEQIRASWEQETAGITIRKNAVIATEVLISASPEYFRPDKPKKAGHWLEDRLNKWRAATEKFIAKHFPHAVSIVLHLDESTPHYQIIDVPVMLNQKGKKILSHYGKFGGSRSTLSKWQDLAASSVKHLGIKRGLKNSTAEHTPIQKYYSALTAPVAELPRITTPKPKPMPPARGMEKIPLSQAAKERKQKEKDREEQRERRLKEIEKRNAAKLKNYDVIEKKANQYDLVVNKLESAKADLQRLQDEIERKDQELEALRAVAKRLRPIDPDVVLKRVYSAQKLSEGVFKVGERAVYTQDAPKTTLAGSRLWRLDGKQGRGAIDLVMELGSCDYKKAVLTLLDHFENEVILSELTSHAETLYTYEIQRIEREKEKAEAAEKARKTFMEQAAQARSEKVAAGEGMQYRRSKPRF
jgi:hypothetical protein